jgi:hypothetical protein
MLKSFDDFINETFSQTAPFISKITNQLIQKIRKSQVGPDYTTFSGMGFTEPFEFDLILSVRKEKSPDLKQDPHFKALPWEKFNLYSKGFAIDANMKINSGDLIIPSVTITILIDPSKEPAVYAELGHRLLDVITHELNHIDQAGRDRVPTNVLPSTQDTRKGAKSSYKYFLLPDEIESMVEGMYARSKSKDVPLDHIFDDYLLPFVQSKYISQDEYLKVIQAWVKHAVSHYPDAAYSEKVSRIINSA